MNTHLLRLSACLFLCVSLNSFAALSIRDLDGDWSNGHEGVYDDVLDITWLADPLLIATFDSDNDGLSDEWHLPNSNNNPTGNYCCDGRVIYGAAKDWAEILDINGHSEWRLPSRVSSEGVPEIAYMFYSTLELNYGESIAGANFEDYITGVNHSFLTSNQNGFYGFWYDNGPNWPYENNLFGFYIEGFETTSTRSQGHHNTAWPVHDGDIGLAPVPLPAGIYLFLSGLVGLGLMRGRNV